MAAFTAGCARASGSLTARLASVPDGHHDPIAAGRTLIAEEKARRAQLCEALREASSALVDDLAPRLFVRAPDAARTLLAVPIDQIEAVLTQNLGAFDARFERMATALSRLGGCLAVNAVSIAAGAWRTSNDLFMQSNAVVALLMDELIRLAGALIEEARLAPGPAAASPTRAYNHEHDSNAIG